MSLCRARTRRLVAFDAPPKGFYWCQLSRFGPVQGHALALLIRVPFNVGKCVRLDDAVLLLVHVSPIGRGRALRADLIDLGGHGDRRLPPGQKSETVTGLGMRYTGSG